MPSTNERKALWFLAAVVLSGSGVRLWRARTEVPQGTPVAALERQLQRVDSVRSAPGKQRRRTPRDTAVRTVATVAIVDLDRAGRAEIEGLPGIGPALAERIVRHRDSAGSFGAVEALCSVRGIGPVLAEKLRPLVTFTGSRRPLSDACGGASRQARKPSTARSGQPR
jgi:competence ComEA-like helix-hairpin-helix protein